MRYELLGVPYSQQNKDTEIRKLHEETTKGPQGAPIRLPIIRNIQTPQSIFNWHTFSKTTLFLHFHKIQTTQIQRLLVNFLLANPLNPIKPKS